MWIVGDMLDLDAPGLDVVVELSYKLLTMSREAQIFTAKALRAGGVVRAVDKSAAKRKR